MSQETVAVVGLGLMGGSLARELAARGYGVLGFDHDAATVRAAREAGVAAHALPAPAAAGLGSARLLVLAVPVAAAPALLASLLPHLHPDCIVTDLGSTKRGIGEAAAELGVADRFVGGHPLTGDHRAGWEASRRGLFEGARVFLCPTPATRPAALARVRSLWTELGAEPRETSAAEHDRTLAWSSHLPQVASSALALALDGAGFGPRELGPGGRDATRLAASSPEMWSAICRENADLIEPAVRALEAKLSDLRAALRSGDPDAIQLFFARSSRWARG
jgi:prephenate dehydrogenase